MLFLLLVRHIVKNHIVRKQFEYQAALREKNPTTSPPKKKINKRPHQTKQINKWTLHLKFQGKDIIGAAVLDVMHLGENIADFFHGKYMEG